MKTLFFKITISIHVTIFILKVIAHGTVTESEIMWKIQIYSLYCLSVCQYTKPMYCISSTIDLLPLRNPTVVVPTIVISANRCLQPIPCLHLYFPGQLNPIGGKPNSVGLPFLNSFIEPSPQFNENQGQILP